MKFPRSETLTTVVLISLLLKLLVPITSLGSPMFHIIPDAILVAAAILTLQKKSLNVDKLMLYFFIYICLHLSANLFYYGIERGYNYTFYRNIMAGIFVYVILNNVDQRTLMRYSIIMFKFITIFIFVDTAVEKILLSNGVNLNNFLPWLQYENPIFGVYSSSRIPTILGAPYPFASISVSLLLIFTYHAQIDGKRGAWLYTILNGVSLAILESRFQILIALVGALAFYLVQDNLRLRKKLIFIILVASLFIIHFNLYQHAYVFTSDRDILSYYEQGGLIALWEFVQFPTGLDWFWLITGKGAVSGWQQFHGLINIASLESAYVTEIIPAYGIIFLVLYIKMFSGGFGLHSSWRYGPVLLITYIFSPFHHWSFPASFFCEFSFLLVLYVRSLGLKYGVSNPIRF